MRNETRLSLGPGALAFILLLATLLACKSSSRKKYWTSGCIPPGSENEVVLAGDETVRLDLATGAVRARKSEYKSELGCFPDGRIQAQGINRRTVGSTASGYVATHVSFDDSQRWDQLNVVGPGGSTRNVDLEVAHFPDIGRGGARLLDVNMVGILGESAAVFSVAYEPTVATRTSVTRRPFAFYAFDLASGAPTRWGAVFNSDQLVHQHWARRYAIARDGSIALGVFGWEDHVVSAGLTKQGSVSFRYTHSGVREPSRAAVSLDGQLAAVGLTLKGGSRCYVDIVDMASGQLKARWPAQPLQGRVSFLQFLKDGSLIVASSAHEAARVSPQGKLIWKSSG